MVFEEALVTSICVGCGMCCDGTMYGTVTVGEDDQRPALAAAGPVITTKEGASSFLLPCPVFRAGCCSIYGDRPAVCRGYRCLLLRRHDAGDISRGDAQTLIGRVLALRDRVRASLTAYVEPDELLTLDDLYRLMLAKSEAEPDRAAALRERGELLLEFVALRRILAREFEPHDSTSHRPPEARPGHLQLRRGNLAYNPRSPLPAREPQTDAGFRGRSGGERGRQTS
jgi:uncharacterized protein